MDKRTMRARAKWPELTRRVAGPDRGKNARLLTGVALVITLAPSALLAEEPWVSLPPNASGQSGLRITCAKTELILGQHRWVELQVEGPAEAKSVTLSAHIGKITTIKNTAPGRWTARYQLPQEYFPQVAILTAHTEIPGRKGPLTGWTTLRLWGNGEAVVKTRAYSMVKIAIKGKLFGPVKADAQGDALVPVLIPPGVEHGYNGDQQVFLHLPQWNRLQAFLSPQDKEGTDPARLTLFLFAVNKDGTAYQGLPQISFPVEPQSPLQPLGPGAWQKELVVPSGDPGELDLLVSLSDSPESQVQLKVIRRRPSLAKKTVPPPIPLAPPRQKKGSAMPVYFWSALALSSSLLAAGTITRIIALDMSNEYLDEATTIERRKELKPTGEALTSFSSIALGVGAGCLVGTAILYWFTDFSGSEVAAGILPGSATPQIAFVGKF